MRRRFRLYGKKRGDRRTGSKRLGGYGEALFFGVFLLVGAAGTYVLLTQLILPEWIANRHFVAHECVVVQTALGESEDDETLFRPDVTIEYTIDGKTYRRTTYDVNHVHSLSKAEAEKALAPFEVGGRYRCWYDPEDPYTVVLVRGYNWWMWLLLIVPVPFLLIGGVGTVHALLHVGTSTERRAALARRAAQMDLFDDGQLRGLDYPNVPQNMLITDSPGTRLAYRLPADAAPGWALLGIIMLCVLWNGIVIWFTLVAAIEPDWFMLLFLLPFIIAGGVILFFTIRQLLRTTGCGTTRIEISGHPLYPGEQYDIFLSQTGLNFDSLQLWLVCEEQATYRQGTNTRTETECVYQSQIYDRRAIHIVPGTSFEDTCRLTVPAEAMHSFDAPHNQVKWKLVARGRLPRWPDYERQFPLVVYPPQELRSTAS